MARLLFGDVDMFLFCSQGVKRELVVLQLNSSRDLVLGFALGFLPVFPRRSLLILAILPIEVHGQLSPRTNLSTTRKRGCTTPVLPENSATSRSGCKASAHEGQGRNSGKDRAYQSAALGRRRGREGYGADRAGRRRHSQEYGTASRAALAARSQRGA